MTNEFTDIPNIATYALDAYGKDALAEQFTMQRHLLNNLASSERLRAFEFIQQSN